MKPDIRLAQLARSENPIMAAIAENEKLRRARIAHKRRARRETIWMGLMLVAAIQAIAAFGYALSHPWLTQTQVFLAAPEWLIPLRWM